MLLIGIGNAFRGDDAAGLTVARAVAARQLAGVEVIEHHGEGAELIELWRDRDRVVVVDAVSSGAAPGTLHHLDAAQPLPANLLCFSSHAFGLAPAIVMARALGRLPASLTVIGIEGKSWTHGAPLDPAVAAAVEEAVGMVLSGA
ncbi:MAG: hydrogenase maturation protease [Alphaproteobacteria bacterium]|nr:hydrogenase maturation protease [Alphaproteobacteria bacterium]